MDVLVREPEVLLTKRLKDSISTALEVEFVNGTLKKELHEYEDSENIPFRLVEQVYGVLSQSGDQQVYLHEMMEGSTVVLQKYEPPPRNPELEARCQKLKKEQDNKKYYEMVRNVNKQAQHPSDSIGSEVKEMNKHILTVFNFIFTVVGSFAFTYKAVEYSLAAFGDTFGLQLIAGMTVATVVFFADLYFLLKYDTA